MGLSAISIIILIILFILLLILIPILINHIFRLIYWKRDNANKPIGMYYDAKLGSINGEVDNRGKFICDCCKKRFKHKRELTMHLRFQKIRRIKTRNG